jgi:hypothetical protein
MAKYTYALKTKWAAEAGIPLGTFLGCCAVIEDKTAKSPLPVRHAAIGVLETYLKANPNHNLVDAEVAQQIGLRANEGGFVRYHTRKLILSGAVFGAGYPMPTPALAVVEGV